MEYNLNTDYKYCVDVYDIKLINSAENKGLTLSYPGAAIFSLLVNRYTKNEMVRMIAQIALVTQDHATEIVNDTLNMLKENNVIR